MSIHDLAPLLRENPFFSDFDSDYLELIAGCASNVKFAAGEVIFREGERVDRFFLLRYGGAAVEVFAPGKGSVTIQTLHPGDILGWSWLIPPYESHHDARAVELTRAVAFDGTCLRDKCEKDPRLGYQLMSHFVRVIVERLQGAQMQLMDFYGGAGSG